VIEQGKFGGVLKVENLVICKSAVKSAITFFTPRRIANAKSRHKG
jgi:hypothetical protein